ncbi:MAG TPA: M48 family metallopeptidase [Desulfomonilaceae bacterium]|nr:M48 family metallopeptidase [Desulfomonilaceae bacterium]
MRFNYLAVFYVLIYLFQMVFSLWLDRLNRDHLKRLGTKVPKIFEGFIDQDAMIRMNDYTVDRSRLFQIRKVITDIVLLGFLLSGFLVTLDSYGARAVSGYIWTGLIFFLVFTAIFFVLDLPFDFYETFFIEEQYGFNKSDFSTWATDNLKSGLLSAVLLSAVLAPLLWIIQAAPNYWWFWGFVVAAALQLVLVVLYPILIAPIFNKFEPVKDEELAHKVEALVKGLGMRTSGIFQMDAGRRSTHSNAYFTGLSKTKRVVLFDTLIQSHSHEEILAVLAHEVGHYKRKHILKSYLIAQLSMLVGFYITFLIMNWGHFYDTFGIDAAHSYLGLLVIGIFWQRISFFLKPVYMRLSRSFEQEADEFAVRAQADARPLAQALKKLASHNLSNLSPHPMYVWFNYSHPPLLQRINHLEAI